MGSESVCAGGADLLFPCSGAADVGALADRAARKLSTRGVCKMYCTAGIGGGVEPILKAAREASTIVALDGCPLDCTKRSLENAGFTEFRHLRVTDMGFLKGKTETAESNVAAVAEAVRTAIAD